MTSVVIPAYNEAAVLDRCLDPVVGPDAHVVVVPNGCHDDTAAVARRRGVTVVELTEGSKTAALNAGDSAAVGFPRLYLDADVVLSQNGLATLAAALQQPGVLAVVPRRVYDMTGRPLLVRAYNAISERLPVNRDSLFGPMAIMLSAEGRARFDTFPTVIADDLFLDSLFAPAEKRRVDAVTLTVATPRRTRALIRRLIRVRAGNIQLRAVVAAAAREPGSPLARADVPSSNRWSWLRHVVLPRPWLVPAGAWYALVTIIAEIGARRALRGQVDWGQDLSTRGPAVDAGAA